MNAKNIILAAFMTVLLGGCFVKSIHPFYRENETVFNGDLLGNWTGRDSTTWKIEQATRSKGLFKPTQAVNVYRITYTEKKGASVFSVHLFKLNNHLYLDFYPEEVEGGTDMMTTHLVPMHTVARVEVSPGRLVIRWFNEEWLIGLFKQNKIRIAHEKIPLEGTSPSDANFQVVLTASTDELQKFMLKYADDPKALSNDYTYELNKTTLK